jgi:hypothetical protein
MQWHPSYEEKERNPRNILGEILHSTPNGDHHVYLRPDQSTLTTPLPPYLFIYLSIIIRETVNGHPLIDTRTPPN